MKAPRALMQAMSLMRRAMWYCPVVRFFIDSPFFPMQRPISLGFSAGRRHPPFSYDQRRLGNIPRRIGWRAAVAATPQAERRRQLRARGAYWEGSSTPALGGPSDRYWPITNGVPLFSV